MKRAVCVLICLLLLSGISVGIMASVIIPQGKAVEYTLQEENGDRSLLEGVTAEFNLIYNNRLKWDVSFSPLGNTETDLTFDKLYLSSSSVYRYQGLDSYWLSYQNLSTVSSQLRQDIKAVCEYVEEGTEIEYVKINLRDYFEYYPIFFEASFDDISINWQTDYSENNNIYGEYRIHGISKERGLGFVDTITEYIKIPVHEDDARKVGITNRDGRYSYSSYTEFGWNMEFYSVSIDNTVYFTITNNIRNSETGADELIDTSLIPGGYGIYAVSFSENDIDYENIRTVYQIGENKSVLMLYKDEQNKNLFLVLRDNGKLIFRVIDIATMTDVCEVYIGETQAEYISCKVSENFVILEDNRRIMYVLEKQADGTYKNALKYEFNEENKMGWYHIPYDYVADFDGERLVLMMLQESMLEEPLYTSSPVFLVIHKDGRIYEAKYKCSLGDYTDINGGFITHEKFSISIS